MRDPGRRAAGLHPSTELVLLVSSLLLVFGIPSPVVPAAIIVASAVGAAVSPRVDAARWLATVAVLAGPMLVMVGIIQGLFYPGSDATVLWSAGPAAVTVEGLAVAAQLWLRVTATIAVCALFGFGADAARTFDGLLGLRMPLGIAYVCATAITLIPLLRARTSEALVARAARGWDTSRLGARLRVMPGILTGLLTSLLVQVDQRHDTLEQRGFGSTSRPTPLQDHRDGSVQRAARWAIPVTSAALVAACLSGVLHLPAASELIGAFDA